MKVEFMTDHTDMATGRATWNATIDAHWTLATIITKEITWNTSLNLIKNETMNVTDIATWNVSNDIIENGINWELDS